jgi:hypothetical protein
MTHVPHVWQTEIINQEVQRGKLLADLTQDPQTYMPLSDSSQTQTHAQAQRWDEKAIMGYFQTSARTSFTKI